MKIKFNNVKVYNNFVDMPKKQTVVVENGVVVFKGEEYNKDVDKEVKSENLAIIPNFKYFNLSDKNNYNIFNLNNLTEQSLEEQLLSFDKNKLTLMYLENPTLLEGEYDTIVPFCKKHNIKIVAVAGRTLNEMGECDKLHGVTPIGYLEEFGVLDLEPIILSGANLDKEDFEKLSYYNASVCLDVTNDWFNGNGLAQLPTIKKYNINVLLNCNNVFKELYSAYFLPVGYYKSPNNITEVDVLNYACFGFNKAFDFVTSICEVGKYANFMVVKNFSSLKDFVLNGKTEQVLEMFGC